ncbi:MULTISPECIES: 3-carboxy-cis,cis-muconate cycloisomerase [unclassified Streptomyces]|jgi:3-carboxy-cis,cis-muconate cycloisomerase|uniref:3-carboxy-cis,cis-muconate cycloisomerase n=1 Tax=unclassified Streptomyces TaxID=2593676 RepID=UPI0029BF6896|nr:MULTISPECIES: 3-carboxy-cis,cis-muconate cycloisomerase [unclassified Streptomyces]MDX3770757.1 3-carboxy-cis,cis-muconate cycloisomerase [Streptomyces sp. AK08-01B]MDX3818476.1 3-carboxy-cis,cis-muconate cycloisomerase [Streptomyces sp. AK08-01A]
MYESDAGLLAPGRAGSPAEATTGDSAFLQAMLDAEAALTRAQSACGLAPAEAGRAVTRTADADRFDVRDLALRARSGGNPVIPLVVDLTAAVPEDARPYVHRGATSQDILDTAAMLVASRTLTTVLDDLERAAGEVARHAATHRDTQMAGRTLTQHAVPTTFGLKAAGWRALILDARDRLSAVRASLPAQLGGAAGTLAAFSAFSAPAASPIAQEDTPGQEGDDGQGEVDLLALVAAYAHELGLAEPVLPWHTLRTPIADLAGALAFTAGALGKMAADVLTLSRTEIGEVEEEEGGDSSALPHKANPVHATLIAAAARRAPGLAATLYGSLPAEDERPAGAWHAEWEPLRDLLRLVGGAAHDGAALAAGLRVVPYTMRENLQLTDGLIVAERLAAVFADRIGRARAREVLAAAAERAHSETTDLADVLFDVLREEPELAGLDLAELTDPTRYTGCAGPLTDRALERR